LLYNSANEDPRLPIAFILFLPTAEVYSHVPSRYGYDLNGATGIMDGQKHVYRLGDAVRIKSGPYTEFMGKVEGINQSKSLLKVEIEIFGRATPVKVRFSDAEKVESQPLTPPWLTRN